VNAWLHVAKAAERCDSDGSAKHVLLTTSQDMNSWRWLERHIVWKRKKAIFHLT